MRRLIRRLVRVETVAVLVIAWLGGALGLGLATGAGAVPTVALMALGLLLGGLLLLIRHNLELASRIGILADQSTRTFDTVQRVGARIERELKKEIKQTFRQLEALQNLSAVLPVNDVLPATRVWAASPDLLVVLVDLVIAQRPSLVVECGSGASTLWLALAMRQFGIDGQIIALEHDPVFGDKTRDLRAPGPLSGAATAGRVAQPGRHRRPGRPRRAGHAESTAALAGRVPGFRLRDPPARKTSRGVAQEQAGQQLIASPAWLTLALALALAR